MKTSAKYFALFTLAFFGMTGCQSNGSNQRLIYQAVSTNYGDITGLIQAAFLTKAYPAFRTDLIKAIQPIYQSGRSGRELLIAALQSAEVKSAFADQILRTADFPRADVKNFLDTVAKRYIGDIATMTDDEVGTYIGYIETALATYGQESQTPAK